MKRFPFKILVVSILLPPIFYIVTLHLLEGYFQKREISELNEIMIQNHEALYEGRYTVKEEINRNISEYLGHSLKYSLGVRTYVLVKTKDDRILYPAQFGQDFSEAAEEGDFSELPTKTLNYMEVAAENYKILNEGLRLSVVVQIKHNSWLSNGVLAFYVLLSVLLLQRFVKKGIRETERQESRQKEVIQRLSGLFTQAESKLKKLEAKEDEYLAKITDFKQDKKELSKDVDALLEEMEKLETGLENQKGLKEEMELEAVQLREELDRLKGRLHSPSKKKKRIDATVKRFRVLYKNLAFTDRAIEGFIFLTDEFQLKAEELIHKLNEDDSQVSVRRKVFGKGGKTNILELDFSYSGRIYFQKDAQPKAKVLAIGTKNTQEQDLAFIENIK
jgi:hypothetical protein